ncbi:unnamed protein product [Polarella glacialis]|uniref:Uncharacterized protein n=1 Tax=Polarella glacialis TaxID=89957 RepID=A0A813LA69_POLGL|nr:unnamed protein product [Polarella glacialis]
MWAFLGPNSAPYMVHLGMGHSLATLNNVAGPIVGFFTGPIVGAWSDRCTSRFGRRRPVILVGLISTWVAWFCSFVVVVVEVLFVIVSLWLLFVVVGLISTWVAWFC